MDNVQKSDIEKYSVETIFIFTFIKHINLFDHSIVLYSSIEESALAITTVLPVLESTSSSSNVNVLVGHRDITCKIFR